MLQESEFRRALIRTLKSRPTITHPLFRELLQPRQNWPLLKLVSLQTYQLTRMFERYVAALLYQCPVRSLREKLAANVYEEFTGKLSGTDGHLELMEKYLHALGFSQEELEASVPLPATLELIEYRRKLVEDPAQYHRAAAAIMIASEGQTIQKEEGKSPHELLGLLYGLTADALHFFTLHATEDLEHVGDGLDMLVATCTTEKLQREAIDTVGETCERFWRHYDGILAAYRALQGEAGETGQASGAVEVAAASPAAVEEAPVMAASPGTSAPPTGVSWSWLDALDDSRVDALAQLMNRVLRVDDTVGYPGPISHDEAVRCMRDLREAVRTRRQLVLVAEQNGRVVGKLVLTPAGSPNNRHTGWITRTMVDPDLRRLGVVAFGVPSLVEKCEELGIEQVCIDVRAGTPAESIWRHLGFEEMGRLADYARVRGTTHEGVYMVQAISAMKQRAAGAAGVRA